ncbi:MAG TPA: iron-sulfur cluster biosynthesis family protein [Alphaproteobacteria bacterium]|nr:iron-sulfur cluster biosynthesis family protein [Alphaproteobacteria bacterium]HNS44834.1 iron-sulfur cluster biosynthesis family protein [Alphaproteobacteria bacterium]
MELKNEILVTDAAKAHLKKVGAGHKGLRLTILGGKGCGGSEYELNPVVEIEAGDDYIDLGEGMALCIPSLDMLKLFGAKVDYIEDDLGNRRLDISNPNETGRCGCGKSVTF